MSCRGPRSGRPSGRRTSRSVSMRGSAAASGLLGLANPLDDPGRGAVLDVGKEVDRAAELLDDGRLREHLAGVVAALDEDVRPKRPDELDRRVLVERDDVVDGRECRQNVGPILERVDRTAGSLEACDALVGVEADDQHVPERLRARQVRDVAAVEDVEAAVREDDGASLALLRGERVAQAVPGRSEEDTAEIQSRQYHVCRLLLEKKKIY